MKQTVLVVDDSPTIRLQVRTALEEAGFRVIEAEDGVEGLITISNTPDVVAVICDVNMPRMSGLQLLLAVKSQQRSAALPVLMLTTEGQPALIERAKEAGANGWIVKPFVPKDLVAAVKKITG